MKKDDLFIFDHREDSGPAEKKSRVKMVKINVTWIWEIIHSMLRGKKK